ncbi:MAG: hypothetical protein M3347_04800, partial [Armatimonadota bacterium]|nr:hypothetical protein [Armatimonadota bacterium]
HNPDRWFCTDFYAIYQTTDAGAHWALSADGVEVTVLFTLGQDPTDAGVVHLGMADNSLFLSTDGGARFSRGSVGNLNMKTIAVAPSDPRRVYAAGDDPPGRPIGAVNQVWISPDRGQSWVKSPLRGLPDMNKSICNSIAVDPKDPYTVYVTITGPVGEGKGGVYKSSDGGDHWTWLGQGLPQNKVFFEWWNLFQGYGREIAAGFDGQLVTFGSGGVYRFDAGSWKPVSLLPGGAYAGNVKSVVADVTHPGRFFLAAEGSGATGGVFRSEDGGATWQRVLSDSTRHVAVDMAKPNRVVAGTRDGVLLSSDGGTTWQPLDRSLPMRFYPVVGFAGDRVLAATIGNGSFWLPLTPEAAQPVTARAVTPAYAQAAAQGLSLIVNGSMSAGAETPEGWTGPSRLEVARDTREFKSGPASLRVTSPSETSSGQVKQSFAIADPTPPLVVGGWLKTAGDLKSVVISLQCYGGGKQTGYIWVASAAGETDWREFKRGVALPAGTTSANFVVSLQGQGQMWLDEVNVAPLALKPAAP